MAESSDNLLDDFFGPLNPTWDPTPSRRVITVATSKLYDDPLYGKTRGVKYDQGLTAWVKLPLTSETTGAPVTIALGNYSSAPVVDVRIREASGADPRVYEPDVPAELADSGTAVMFAVPPEVANMSGVFRAQIRVVDAQSIEKTRDEFWIYVDRGLWTTTGDMPQDIGPPTFSEVRTAMRDHPVANRLLAEYEFDPAEIGMAVVSAVQRFNGELPPLPRQFLMSTINLPGAWRRQLLNGTLSYLFETAATYFRRGDLPYNSGGLAVNDLAKNKDYQQAIDRLREEFLRWIKLTRMSINLAAAHGSVGSGFPAFPTY